MVVLVGGDGFAGDVGWADGLVGFLGGGGFGFEFAHSRIIRAVQPLDKVSRTGDGLPAQIDRVGTHVGDFTVLVEPLGRRHGSFGAKAELCVSFLLQG